MISFRIFGTKIYISFSFTVCVTFLAIIDKTGLLFVSFAAVLFHEIGHLVIMKLKGIKEIEVSLILASVKVSINEYLSVRDTALIAFGGPFLNLVLSASILFNNYYLQYFGAANIILFFLNMLPISNLDGGDILKYFLTILFKRKADKVFIFVSCTTLMLLTTLGGLFFFTEYNNPTVLIVGIYLIIMSYKKV